MSGGGTSGKIDSNHSFRMIGIGSCNGEDSKKSVSKSSTGRSSSKGLEGIPVSLSSYLAILS